MSFLGRALPALLLCACLPELGSYEDPPGAGGAGSAGNVGHGATLVTTTESGGGGLGDVTGAEKCWNAIDDDGDGRVDCADDDCGGYYCVAAPPADLNAAAILARDGECDSPAFPQAGPAGTAVVAAPDKCPCACGDAGGATGCSATVQLFGDAACATQVDTETASGPCTTVSSLPAAAARATVQPTGGSCAPMNGDVTPPTLELRTSCSTPFGGGCQDGFVCVRPPADGPLCFYRQGRDSDCDGAYPDRIVLFDRTPEDERSCVGSCGCQPPTGGTCTGQVALHTSCAGSLIEMSNPGACDPFPAPEQVGGIGVASLVAGNQGTCEITPRQQVGGFTGAGTTLCCSDDF